VKAGIHPLAAKGTVDVSGITREKDTTHAQGLRKPVMNPEIAAPMERASLESWRTALGENPLDQLERRSLADRFSDCANDPTPRGAHRKDGNRTMLVRTKLHLRGGERIVRRDIGKEKQVRVLTSLEPDIGRMPYRAVCAIAPDNKGRAHRFRSA